MPHPFGHIACCVDGSPSGTVALETSLALWGEAGGRLSLLHNGPSWRDRDPAELADEWLRRRGAEMPGAEPVFLTGEHGAAVCDWAQEAHPDVIVVGARSGRLPGLVAGGFVHDLLERAPCTVLVVGARARA